eukprot:PDM74883.1 rpoa-49 [Pristionchus pacificus]
MHNVSPLLEMGFYQGASSSEDAPPQEESQGSSSPQYIEMMPMRVSNGGVEQMGIDGGGGGGEEFPLEEMIGEDTIGMGLEGEVGDVNKTNGDKGGGGEKKSIPPVDEYNMKKKIREFWPVQKQRVEKMSVKYLREASRNQVLPLARVKKIMKIDENVQKQMIAADAPLLLSVASEMFIEELTLRSWEITEESKRKTLQKTDVATASTRHEHMDFLIDIIPRTGIQPRPKEQMKMGGGGGGGHAQMVQIVREGGPTVGQLLKGGAILAEGVPSTSSQQEFSARLESGEEAQVIQIGKPIPLSRYLNWDWVLSLLPLLITLLILPILPFINLIPPILPTFKFPILPNIPPPISIPIPLNIPIPLHSFVPQPHPNPIILPITVLPPLPLPFIHLIPLPLPINSIPQPLNLIIPISLISLIPLFLPFLINPTPPLLPIPNLRTLSVFPPIWSQLLKVIEESSSQMASSPKKSRKRGLPDMIAHFPHNKPRRAEEMMIEEHKVDHEEKAYTVMNYAANCSSVFEVGREVPNPKDGNEYAVVLVNKRTGDVSAVKPAHIVSFQAVYAEDLEEAIGKKKKKTIDFAKDFGVKKEEWMNAKNSLSLQFAGTKKLRMLEASKRREINENTLEEMRKTAFASEGTLLSIMNDTRKEAMIDEKISLINKAESEVLPKFVNAELAKDVYPLDMFMSKSDAEECAEEVKEMWRKSREELEADGIERCVYEIYKQIQRTNQSLVSCALLAGIAGSMKRLNRGMLAKEKYEEMKLPKGVLQKLRLDFLQGNWRLSRGVDSIAVKQTDKERMIAHALALAVTLSPTLMIPITPWSRVLNVNEAKMVKTLEALGCTVFNLPASDAVKYTSIRAARLLSAPKEEQGRRRFRK